MAVTKTDVKIALITGVVFSIATLVIIQATKGIERRG